MEQHQKHYHLIKQEGINYCLCSVLQAILCRHGMFSSQETIAQQLTPTSNGFATDDERIRSFLQSNGFLYSHHQYNQVPFNEPDFILKEMHDYDGIVGIQSHAYLLQSFKDPMVELIDPLYNKIVSTELTELRTKMADLGGFYALITL